MKFKTKFRNFFELLRDTRLSREPQYSPIPLNHVHELLELMRVMSGNNEYEEYLNQNANTSGIKGDEITMNDVVSLGFKRKFDEGKAEGEFKATFTNLKNLMKNSNCSIDTAMDLLSTPLHERQHYKDLLAKGM